jgi:hypothetical protein
MVEVKIGIADKGNGMFASSGSESLFDNPV